MKPLLLTPKWDTFMKHEGRRKANKDLLQLGVKAGEWYTNKTYKHKKNPGLTTMLQQVNKNNHLESKRKKVQFATLFQILKDGHPMVKYEKKKVLYSFIGVPKNPKMYWLDSSSWIMVEFMYAQVTNAIMVVVSIANHVALTCDEVSTMDNKSWISIHAYLMQNWVKIPMLISLQKVIDGIGVDNLIVAIMEALQKARCLSP
jgi:hypothetical protein